MADVKMPLEELRELENKAKVAEELVSQKQKEINDLNIKLTELEGKKPIVERYIEYPTKFENTSIDKSTAISMASVIMSRIRISGIVYKNTREYAASSMHDLYTVDPLEAVIIKALEGSIYTSPVPNKKVKPEVVQTLYLNFDEIKEELKKRAEDQVAGELGQLRSQATELKALESETRAQITKEHNRYVDGLKLNHQEEVTNLTKQIQVLNQKYTDLQEERDTRSAEMKLQEEIDKLKIELETEKARGFWDKLFN